MGIQFSGLASGLDTQSIIADLMKLERTKSEKVEKQKTMVEWKKEAWKEMNNKIYSFYKSELFNFKSSSTYNKKTVTSSNTSAIKINSSPDGVNGSHDVEVTNVAKGSFLTGTELGSTVTSSTTMGELAVFAEGETKALQIKLADGDAFQEITVAATDTISSVINKIKDLDLDLNISFDNNFKRIFTSSQNTGDGIKLSVSGDDSLLTALGFGAANRTGSLGEDATFVYNGATLSSSTNEVSVNGISMTILGEGSSTISVSQNTDEIYDSIKSFLTKYNELIAEITEKTSAASARKFSPLTAEEKDAMTETEVELWEGKIKGALFRNDQTLIDISSSLRNTLTINQGVDTSSFSIKNLADLGIVTGNYTEKGLLHIQGDEDDTLYALKENKLRKAIEEDPDGVMELMTALGGQLYSDFGEKMKSSSLSSAFTFYNDKQLDKQVSAYETELEKLEERYTVIEERYYSQFTAMEQAMQKSQSTSDWLSQQLGGM